MTISDEAHWVSMGRLLAKLETEIVPAIINAADRYKAQMVLQKVRCRYLEMPAPRGRVEAFDLLAKLVPIFEMKDQPKRRRPVGSKLDEEGDILLAFVAWWQSRDRPRAVAKSIRAAIQARRESGLKVKGNSEEAIERRIRKVLDEYRMVFEKQTSGF